MVLKRKNSPLRMKSEAYSIRIANLYHYLLEREKKRLLPHRSIVAERALVQISPKANMLRVRPT